MEQRARWGILSQFQGVDANKEGTFKLVLSINDALGNPLLDEERTRRAFAVWWPHLEKTLSEIPRTVTQEIGGQIVGDYRAEGSLYYINTISHLGGEIFRIVNKAWEGVGLYDGKTYCGIYKYNDADPARCGIWGTHEAELVFKEGRRVLRVQGWEMLEVSGLTRWKEPGEWFKADG